MRSYTKLFIVAMFNLWAINARAVCSGAPDIVANTAAINIGTFVRPPSAVNITVDPYGTRTLSDAALQVSGSTIVVGQVTVTGTNNCSFSITQNNLTAYVANVIFHAPSSCITDGTATTTGNLSASGTCTINVGVIANAIPNSIGTGQ